MNNSQNFNMSSSQSGLNNQLNNSNNQIMSRGINDLSGSCPNPAFYQSNKA